MIKNISLFISFLIWINIHCQIDTLRKNRFNIVKILPQEFEYGLLSEKNNTNNSLIYLAYHFRICNSKQISFGSSYLRMFKQNNFSLFLLYEFKKKDWTSFDNFIKIEPIFDVSKIKINYINLEYNLSWFLSISPSISIPTNLNNNIIYGIRFGYYLPYPISICKKK